VKKRGAIVASAIIARPVGRITESEVSGTHYRDRKDEVVGPSCLASRYGESSGIQAGGGLTPPATSQKTMLLFILFFQCVTEATKKGRYQY